MTKKMSPKDKVMKMIEKRMATTKNVNKRISTNMGLNAIVLEFIESIEKISTDAINAMDFEDGLNRASRTLEMRMKGLDEDVRVDILWHKEDSVDKWRDLRVDSVKVVWSDKFLEENPTFSKEYCIDIGVLMLEGLLG